MIILGILVVKFIISSWEWYEEKQIKEQSILVVEMDLKFNGGRLTGGNPAVVMRLLKYLIKAKGTITQILNVLNKYNPQNKEEVRKLVYNNDPIAPEIKFPYSVHIIFHDVTGLDDECWRTYYRRWHSARRKRSGRKRTYRPTGRTVGCPFGAVPND